MLQSINLKRSSFTGSNVLRAQRDIVGPSVRQRRRRLRQDQPVLHRLSLQNKQDRYR